MRPYHASGASMTAVLALVPPGCGNQPVEETIRAVGQELVREVLVHDAGPWVITGVVGASAPPAPPIFSPLCADAALRLWLAQAAPDLKRVPSVFEVPDLDRQVRARRTGPNEWAVEVGR